MWRGHYYWNLALKKDNETADNDAEKFVREKLNASSRANPYAFEIIFPQDAPKEIRGNFLSKLLLSMWVRQWLYLFCCTPTTHNSFGISFF